MKKNYNTIFKTAPEQTFKEFFNEQMQVSENTLNEAKQIVREAGYRVINEGKLAKFIAGAALSLGLITNAQAGEFNAHANPSYTSKTANTSSLSHQIQKDFNVEDNVQLTDQMVWNIADSVSANITKRLLADNDKIDALENKAMETQEFKNAVEFYKILKKQDPSLANMFSRRLDKALTKSLGIVPNIQYVAGL